MPHRLGHLDRNNPWFRDSGGGLVNNSQNIRKRRNRGRYGRDPNVSQWDWLYGSFFGNPGIRPPVLNPSRTREGLRTTGQLTTFGYSPSGTTTFNPRGGTLGGIRPVAGVSGVRPPTDPMGAPGSLAKYRDDIISDLYARRRLSGMRAGTGDGSTGGKGAQSGMATGDPLGDDGTMSDEEYRRLVDSGALLDGDQEADYFVGAGVSSRGRPRNTIRGNNATGGDDLFAGLDPLSRAIRLAGQEGQLSAMGQYRALANLGIFGPGGMQTILEQAEGPENAILDALPGRTSELLNYNKTQSANQRRRQLAGLGSQLGRTGVQRPGVAGAIAAGSAVPVNIAEQDRAFGIQQNAYNTEDQINLGQGQRRAGLLESNMRSKAAGVAGLGGRADQIAGILGQQFLDPTNPLQNQLNFQTNIMDQQFQNQRSLAGQQQGYARINMQYQGYLDRLLSTNQINQQTYARLWLEQKYKEYGLGNYNTTWSDYIDAFMPDTIAIGG